MIKPTFEEICQFQDFLKENGFEQSRDFGYFNLTRNHCNLEIRIIYTKKNEFKHLSGRIRLNFLNNWTRDLKEFYELKTQKILSKEFVKNSIDALNKVEAEISTLFLKINSITGEVK